MSAAVWIALTVLIAVLADRAGLYAERRGWIYWRKRKPEGGGEFGEFGEFETLLSPSFRHIVEEQQRQRTSRHEQGTGADPLGVDLDAGTVRWDRTDWW
ncbi:DUF6191 domain-containing protein [Rhodococcus phenolicus]|uniref:DUF6191 domain-containing protein n=1 Tax=Rhodococcus phenolicus TaxID=263849 RepID=UPI00082B5F78|nr:DUF6191 domain-containing protein [Rhodococcus phenolicus]